MAGTGASSPFIKSERDQDHFSVSNGGYGQNPQQSYNGSHQPYSNQFDSHNGHINPLALMSGTGFSPPSGPFHDHELLEDTLPPDHRNLNSGYMDSLDFSSTYASNNTHGQLSSNNVNYSSNTPEEDIAFSPFASNFPYGPLKYSMQQPQNAFSNSIHSPSSYNTSDLHNGSGSRPRLSRPGRQPSNTKSPMTPVTPVISSLNLGSAENSSFATPIRTSRPGHQKNLSGQWDQTPSSLNSFPNSFSPHQGIHPNPQISDILKGASMPTKLPNNNNSVEMKRRRRRESHNLVERRRRDNINERIQELSHLVPLHRLEDEKVRKALQNNSPLSPTLAGLSHPPGMSPPQATSGLAGPGARRATAGNITTGIPIEEKDKGPNKGDILNGAVSWTRDLMWMLHLKMQQQEELNSLIQDLGGSFPFQETEDEQRMRTELMDAMVKNDGTKFHYSRAPGSGLRVPKHTDVKGEPLGGSATSQLDPSSLSPDNHSSGDAGQAGMGNGQYWSGHNSGGSGPGSIGFKEEDEYTMDLN